MGGGSIYYSDVFNGAWRQVFSGFRHDPQALCSTKDGQLFIAGVRNNFRSGDLIVSRKYNKGLWKDVQRCWNGNEDNTIENIFMFDTIDGFYFSNTLFKTSDEGYIWNPLITTHAPTFFLDKNIAWSVEDKIYKTNNSCISWTEQYTPNFRISDLMFINENVGYACGSNDSLKGKVIKSTNGGATWIEVNIPPVNHLTTIAFTNKDTGIVAGWSNIILLTYDGGITWTIRSKPNQLTIDEEVSSALLNKSKNKKNLIIKQNDFYKTITSLDSTDILDAVFKKNVILLASGKSVLKSSDYGSSWKSNYIGDNISEVEYDGYNSEIALGDNNVYFNRAENNIPVSLTSFSGFISRKSAVLNWSTATELNNSGFEVELLTGINWKNIGFVKGNGTTSEMNNYTFIHDNPPSGLLKYRLKQIDFSGEYTYSDELLISSDASSFNLTQNYPNPFNSSTKFNYQIPQRSNVEIRIVDILGREYLVENTIKEMGYYEETINSAKLNLSSGVYFLNIKSGSNSSTIKIIVLK